jgi:DNA-binding response OmpR family regulator
MGANDYITKPFAIEELLARIRAVLRPSAEKKPVTSLLRAGSLTMDVARHTVTYDGTVVALTFKEFLLLQTLMENQDLVLSRDTLLEKVWGYDYMGETNVVDVYIRYLRHKIDEVFGVHLIQTVRGVGYVLKGNAP